MTFVVSLLVRDASAMAISTIVVTAHSATAVTQLQVRLIVVLLLFECICHPIYQGLPNVSIFFGSKAVYLDS
jgi:hypothetical protein